MKRLQNEHVQPQKGKVYIPSGKIGGRRELPLMPWQVMELLEYIKETQPELARRKGTQGEELFPVTYPMNIEATKLELMHLLLQTQKETLLAKVKKVFEDEQVDWWDDLDEEEKKEIETGIAEADNGQLTSHDKVMKRFDKWR